MLRPETRGRFSAMPRGSPLMRHPLGGRRTCMVQYALSSVLALLQAGPALASSGRNFHKQLAGIKVVSVFVIENLDGLDGVRLAEEVKEHLRKAGLTVGDAGGTPQLVVSIDSSPLETALCPGLVSLQVRLSLREPVEIRRIPKLNDVLADTWATSKSAELLSTTDVADFAWQDALILVDSFAGDVAYSSAPVAQRTR